MSEYDQALLGAAAAMLLARGREKTVRVEQPEEQQSDKPQPLLVVQWPAEVLRTRAQEVAEINDDIRQITSAMFATMVANNGVGLAAPQVGVPLRIIVGRGPGWQFALVNPVITKRSPQVTALMEGCLSFQGKGRKRVYRPKMITVEGHNMRGEHVRQKARGLLAAVLQHEIDHLDGINLEDKKGPWVSGRR